MATRTILLVDGDSDTRVILRAAFESRGYHVLDTADPATGLMLARERVPDVILGNFPPHPFLERIRSDPHLGAVRTVAFTTYILDADIRALWEHADRVIAKPSEPRRVIDAVEELLDDSGMAPKA